MADLSKFWRDNYAIWSQLYDQKAMMAREMIAEHFDAEDSEKPREINNHFSRDERVVISLMGVLAQCGLAAIAMDDCRMDEDVSDG